MEVINIYTPSGMAIPLISYEENRVVTEAKCTRVFQGEEYIKIEVESATQLEIPLYSYIDYKGERYRMNRPIELKQEWHNLYMYSIELESVRYELGRVLYDTSIDPTQVALEKVYSGGSFGNLYHFADMLVANLKRALGVTWRIEGADRNEKGGQLLSFERGENCLSALHKIAQSFHVFFFTSENVDTGERTLRFVSEYSYNPTPSARWNIGDALFSVERKYVATDNIITRLWCFGSEEGAKKAGDRLTLPFKDMSDSYIEDPEKVRLYGLSEGVFIDEESKPSYTGSVSKTTDDHLTFHSSSWNMFSHLEDGATAKVHFETGGLQGMEFSVKRVGNGTITINPIKDKDLKLEYPSKDAGSPYRIGVGDTFKCIGIEYPFSVISDAQERLKISGTLHYNDVSTPKMEYSLILREGYTTEAQVGDVVEIIDSYSQEPVNLMIQQMETDLLSPLGECSVKVSNFRRKARVEEIFSNWKKRLYAILTDRSVFDKIYSGLSAESIIARVNTHDFRMSIKDILKGDKAFVEATKGLDGKSVSIEEARDAIISSEVFISGISSSLKDDEQFVRELKGRDGAGAYNNLLKGYKDKIIVIPKGGNYAHSSLVPEKFLESNKNYLLVANYTCTSEKKPDFITLYDYFATKKRYDTAYNGNPTRIALFVPASNRASGTRGLLGYAGMYAHGENISAEYSNIMLLEWGDSWDGVIPPYFPHIDDLKTTPEEVSASLIASNDFKANLSVSTAKILNGDSEFKTSVKGEKGDKGERGLQGVQGVPGAKGADGKSVKLSDLGISWAGDRLTIGGVTSESLKGETGAKGERGERGLQGAKGLLEFNYYTEEQGSGVIASANSTPSVLHIVLNGWSGEARMPRLSTTALGTVVYVSYSSRFILQCPAGEYIPKLFFFENEKPYDATFHPIPVSTHNGMLRMDLISARDCKGFYSFIATAKITENGYGSEKCWVLTNSSSVRDSAGVERLEEQFGSVFQQFRNYKQQTDSYITSLSTNYQSLLQKFNELKNKTLVKGEGLQLGFYNLINHNSGTYHVKATDYHIVARRTANGDNYPYIRVSESLPNGHEFIVDIPFNDCRVRFVMPAGGATWGNGGTEWQSGYRYHVTKSHTKEWGVIKTVYAQ